MGKFDRNPANPLDAPESLPFLPDMMTGSPPGGLERRRHPRVRLQARVRVAAGGRPVGELSIRDISVGGAYLSGEIALGVGTVVHLTVASGRLEGAQLHAEVMHVGSPPDAGIGVSFRHPSSAIEDMIQETVICELERKLNEE